VARARAVSARAVVGVHAKMVADKQLGHSAPARAGGVQPRETVRRCGQGGRHAHTLRRLAVSGRTTRPCTGRADGQSWRTGTCWKRKMGRKMDCDGCWAG
jgi:hypothetical protein